MLSASLSEIFASFLPFLCVIGEFRLCEKLIFSSQRERERERERERDRTSAVVRWDIGSISPGRPISFFLFQPFLHNWCNRDGGIHYPVCGILHIKYPLLLIVKTSP